MMHPYRCDSCGRFLDPEQWRECDKCHNEDRERARKHSGEVKHETGTQDD